MSAFNRQLRAITFWSLGSLGDATWGSLGAAAPYHLYLLTHHDDVPFAQDGLRDGEHLRAWMTARFADRLTAGARRWRWLRGDRARLGLRRAARMSAGTRRVTLGPR